jgi:hypothetical protein
MTHCWVKEAGLITMFRLAGKWKIPNPNYTWDSGRQDYWPKRNNDNFCLGRIIYDLCFYLPYFSELSRV